MRLGQIRFENKLTAAVFDRGEARPVPGYSMVELIRKAVTEGIAVTELAEQMASRHPEAYAPAIPIGPVEVWGCECPRTGRPQVFFKGTARTCVGPGRPIGIRFDSKFTVPEPGLAVVLGPNGSILGYTLGDDVTARDFEAENPLNRPQAKIYTGSCALGPVIVTADELPGLGSLEMGCAIRREDAVRFSGSATLRPIEEAMKGMIEYLLRANKVPAGSVLLIGTGIRPGDDAALAAGDTVHVSVPEIGELVSAAAVVE